MALTTNTTTLTSAQSTTQSAAGGSVSAGISASSVTTTSGTTQTEFGTQYTYKLVLQIPVPFLDLNLNAKTLANFVLAQLSPLHVPQAMQWFQQNANAFFQAIVEDISDMVKLVPEASILLQVKLGPAVLLNLQFIAQKVPMQVSLPTFSLGLPNVAVDLNFNPASLLALPPLVMRIPIPVPIYKPSPLLKVSGGNISGQAGVSTASPTGLAVAASPLTSGVSNPLASNAGVVGSPVPPSLTNPIMLPKI
jgi:hypothetical protein